MAPTHVLVTGSNRGIGLGLVERFLAQPDHVVVAAVRNTEHPTAVALNNLPKASGSRVIVVKYDASIWQSPFDAVKELTEKHGISHLDVVVANAAVAKAFPTVKDAKREDIVEHFETNVLSAVSLYQAVRDLLQKSTAKPIYAIMGSSAGSLGKQPPVPNAAYGATKAILPWYAVRLNAEDEWLNPFVLDPGWTQTEMGNLSAQLFGFESAPTTIADSCDGLVKMLQTATKEVHGGKMMLYTGEILDW